VPSPRAARAALLPGLALAAGCMLREVPADHQARPSDHYRGWQTARSAHFVVHTDAGLGAITATLTRFEETYHALQATFFPEADVPRVEALVFQNGDDYRAVAGDTAGRFIPGVGDTGSLLLVRHSENPRVLDRVVAHELAHRFTRAVHPALPNWLSEGLAMYLESADVRDHEVRFGAPPREVHDAEPVFRTAGGVSFTALIQATPDRMYGIESSYYYAAAWALVHHLLTGREGALRPRFRSLTGALERASLERRPAAEAFAAVYPDVTATELDAAVQRLTDALDRPSVFTVDHYPFHRPAPPAIDRHTADTRQVLGLAEAARARKRPRQDTAVDLAARPHVARVEAAPGFRLGYLGLGYGRIAWHPFAWEASLGLGPLGWEAAGLVRGHVVFGDGGNFFFTGALGPVAAVKSRWLGNGVEHDAPRVREPRGFYYFLGLQPQAAFEVRSPSNALARLTVGANLALLENLAALCARDPASEGAPIDPSCRPAEGRSGAQLADRRYDLFTRFSLGYSW
jgi:hypothetical protein